MKHKIREKGTKIIFKLHYSLKERANYILLANLMLVSLILSLIYLEFLGVKIFVAISVTVVLGIIFLKIITKIPPKIIYDKETQILKFQKDKVGINSKDKIILEREFLIIWRVNDLSIYDELLWEYQSETEGEIPISVYEDKVGIRRKAAWIDVTKDEKLKDIAENTPIGTKITVDTDIKIAFANQVSRKRKITLWKIKYQTYEGKIFNIFKREGGKVESYNNFVEEIAFRIAINLVDKTGLESIELTPDQLDQSLIKRKLISKEGSRKSIKTIISEFKDKNKELDFLELDLKRDKVRVSSDIDRFESKDNQKLLVAFVAFIIGLGFLGGVVLFYWNLLPSYQVENLVAEIIVLIFFTFPLFFLGIGFLILSIKQIQNTSGRDILSITENNVKIMHKGTIYKKILETIATPKIERVILIKHWSGHTVEICTDEKRILMEGSYTKKEAEKYRDLLETLIYEKSVK